MSPLIWADDTPTVEPIGDVFRLTLSSGGVESSFALSRGALTAITHIGITRLNEPRPANVLEYPAKRKRRKVGS